MSVRLVKSNAFDSAFPFSVCIHYPSGFQDVQKFSNFWRAKARALEYCADLDNNCCFGYKVSLSISGEIKYKWEIVPNKSK